MTTSTEFDRFLARYEPAIEALARALKARMDARLPGATRTIYDNYNGLVIGYGPDDKASDAILSLAVIPRWVNLFFLRGAVLDDPAGVLLGEGNQVRHIKMHRAADFDAPAIEPLIAQAVAAADPPLPGDGPAPLVIKSISAKQRPRRPA